MIKHKLGTSFNFINRPLSILLLTVLITSLLAIVGKQNIFVQAQAAKPKSEKSIPHRHFRPVCATSGKDARCHAHLLTDDSGSPLGSNVPLLSSYGPSEFHTAYNLPCTPGGAVQAVCNPPSSFGGQTIGIIDAYNAPNIESDLNTYSSYYGLPSCTKANGCLQIVNENGGTTLPATNSGWALETSLDVEVAHMICQTCKILLVEANSSSFSDLGISVNTAVTFGATEISNSYGGSEWSGQTIYDYYYSHPGIAVTVSSGDSGYGTEFPAASPNVVAVGGTTLHLFSDNTYANESVWNGAGSGCSSFESANSWQTNLSNWSQTNCGINRAIADVAADADPNTGAAVYDSTPYFGTTGWYQVGGTSLGSPLIAAVYALAGGVPANTNASSLPYAQYTGNNFHDVTSGSNGTCSTIMCLGVAGYDGPTGLGTPNGLNGFSQASISGTPTPTPTGTPTATPTFTPTPTQAPSDITPPSITITNPINGTVVNRSSYVNITANASDDVGVTKVAFYINNVLYKTDTTNPYSYNWHVSSRRGYIYTIKATAYDAAGNSSSSTVTVTSSS